MPVVSCQTSERLEATVAKVSFNKCPFLGESHATISRIKILVPANIFINTRNHLYSKTEYLSLQTWCIFRFFFGGGVVFFIFGFVVKFCLFVVDFFLLSMETLYLCLKVIYTTQITCIMAHIKEGGGRGIQTVKPGKYHILWLNYM